MVQVLVIADDLTGANATGVQLTKHQLKVHSLIDINSRDKIQNCDCIVYSTNSRAVPSHVAYDAVYSSVGMLKSSKVRLYSKRIDSTLRGNIGKETDAMLDALLSDKMDAMALVVPCFPDAGRVNINGCLYVNGVPLHKTEAAADPKNPIDTNVVADIFAKQSNSKISTICKEELAKGSAYLTGLIQQKKQEGVRILIFDAEFLADLALIAHSAIESQVNFVAVDPGVFTSVVSGMLLRDCVKLPKVLVIVGSTNQVAAKQVDIFLQKDDNYNVFVNASKFLEGEHSRNEEISRVVQEILIANEKFRSYSVIGSGIYPQNRINLASDASDIINNAFAEIAYKILLADRRFKSLYTSGGDISVAVCNKINAFGMNLCKEIVPLASFGVLKGGQFDGLRYITKGGMVGDENALTTCVDFLQKIEQDGDEYE